MKDKVLQRKMFREKALKKYGGDMLPKYKTGDLNVTEKPQGKLDSGLASLRKVFGNNFLNVTGEDKNTSSSAGQPYNSKQAMVLAIAGQLLQAQQRPGESMFSGVGRGVGKALTEDFPVIQKLSLEDRAARTKTGSLNLVKVTDLSTGEEEKQIPYNEYVLDQQQPEPRYMFGKSEKYTLGADVSGLGKKGDNRSLSAPARIYYLKNLGAEKFAKTFLPYDSSAFKYDEYIAKLRADEYSEQLKEDNKGISADINKKSTFIDLATRLEDTISGDGFSATLGSVGGAQTWLDNTLSGLNTAISERGVFGVYRTSEDLKYGDAMDIESDLEAIRKNKDLSKAEKEKQIEDYITNYEDSKGNQLSSQSGFGLTKTGIKQFAVLDAKAQTLVIELAYALAKAREEGGRFSVSDIELAMRSVGNGNSREQALAKIAEIKKTAVNDVVTRYFNHVDYRKYLSEIRAGKMTEQAALEEIAKADPRIIPYIKPYLIGKGFVNEEDDGIKL